MREVSYVELTHNLDGLLTHCNIILPVAVARIWVYISDFIWLKEKKTKRKLTGHVHILVIDT